MKFNNKKLDHVSYENGVAYLKSVEEDWCNFLMTSMCEDTCYENKDSQIVRFIQLCEAMRQKYGVEFMAKAALFVRNEIGQRSISNLLAAWLNQYCFRNKRLFYNNYCHRPDDVAETFAATDFLQLKRSHGMVRGFGDYLSSLGEYHLDKYRMNNKTYSMMDCINICHSHSNAINSFKRDTIVPANTWEKRLSCCTTDEEKAAVWADLLETNSLGYLALLRNIRNIVSVCDSNVVFNLLCPAIVNEKAIEKSLVYPIQIYNAYLNIKKCSDLNCINEIIRLALENAFNISTKNMPKLNGANAIILDVSGSMEYYFGGWHSCMTMAQAGACYAAAIAYANPDVDIIKFANRAVKMNIVSYRPFDIIDELRYNSNLGFGTVINSAYRKIHKYYDRIFIISDFQVMDKKHNLMSQEVYAECYDKNNNTKVYSFDLSNYSTTCLNPNEKNIYLFSTLSPKIFDFISLYEENSNLIEYIDNLYNESFQKEI